MAAGWWWCSSSSSRSSSMLPVYILGAGVRLWLFTSPAADFITKRVEVSTPINAWKRVEEGVFLYSQGFPVYKGGVFHETPLCLLFSDILIRLCQEYLPLVFVLCDLMTAFLLSCVAHTYTHKQEMINKSKPPPTDSSSYTPTTPTSQGGGGVSCVVYVCALYLFCPYNIASCVAQTTSVFGNLVLAALLLAMIKGYPMVFGFLVALASYQSFYPVCLMVPGIISLLHHDTTHSHSHSHLAVVVKALVSFSATLTALMILSAEINGGTWDFIEATYGFILSAPDLSPNIGLFWYFFTEMFEHFRLFFLATFQINAFVYVLPLSIRLHSDPTLLATALLAFTAVFRSYPSLADVGFYLSLVPMWRHLHPFMRQTFIVGCMFVSTSVLGPIMYNLWIFSGSANANFYFAVTLAFNTAQIFLVTDLLFAYVKWEYQLTHGSKIELYGGQARLTLQ